MLTKKEIADALGLSCVEKYFLAWLGKYCDITRLYGCEFVSLAQVFDDFARGATYQNYCYLQRLQDVAQDLGIVNHGFITCSAAEAIEYINKISDDKLCLIRVNGNFFEGFKRSAWREDHYVCLNKKLEWITEYPLATGVFDEQNFARVFDGAVCTYTIKDIHAECTDNVTSLFADQRYSPQNIPRNLNQLESAVGILRVTRKRLKKFYEKNARVAELLDKENALLDKLYFNTRLCLIKDVSNNLPADFMSDVQETIEIENKIAEELAK